MRPIDDTGLLLAKYQADLFEYTVSALPCSSAYFYKRFAFSKLAVRMDRRRFIMEALDVPGAIEELQKEGNYTVGHVKAPPAVMAWIGYLTRYWSYTYEISTRVIYKYVKFDELCRLYEAYHSLDVEAAIQRINEAHNIKYLGDPEYKMDILRQMMR
ncbi:MAG: antitoxin [Clostridia bacterium]|nr:antitoxin [Clostridia bacterium]